MLRVVLDTSVVVSALVFPSGALATLRQSWQQARFLTLVSAPTIEELVAVLGYPKLGLTADDQLELLGDYLPYCTVVTLDAHPPSTPPCRDPWDVPFLELAAAGLADLLVSGDRDLLALGHQPGYHIGTPQELIRILAAD